MDEPVSIEEDGDAAAAAASADIELCKSANEVSLDLPFLSRLTNGLYHDRRCSFLFGSKDLVARALTSCCVEGGGVLRDERVTMGTAFVST